MSLESILRARETAVRAVRARDRKLKPPPAREKELLTKMQRDFNRFHELNPGVYDELVKIAREAKAEGARKLGLRMCWETMRFRTKRYLEPEDGRQNIYRLNDHYCPYYARLIMDREPDLNGVFNVRRLRSVDPITVDEDHRPIARAA